MTSDGESCTIAGGAFIKLDNTSARNNVRQISKNVLDLWLGQERRSGLLESILVVRLINETDLIDAELEGGTNSRQAVNANTGGSVDIGDLGLTCLRLKASLTIAVEETI